MNVEQKNVQKEKQEDVPCKEEDKCIGRGCTKIHKPQIGCCKTCSTETNLRCNRCKQVYYCGKECQRKDWKEGYHKRICRSTKEKEKEEKEEDEVSIHFCS